MQHKTAQLQDVPNISFSAAYSQLQIILGTQISSVDGMEILGQTKMMREEMYQAQ
jgi:hypothetical protein